MDKETWKARILDSLNAMADEQFQRRAWTGAGPEISSLVEVICGLFDDAMLREYIQKYAPTLTQKALSDFNDLDSRIQNLNTDYLDNLPIFDVINNTDWVEIRIIAKRLQSDLEQDVIE